MTFQSEGVRRCFAENVLPKLETMNLFQMGGVLFMSILTIILIGVLATTAYFWIKKNANERHLDLIKSVGLLAFVVGILGQMIGLFSAFEAIEQMGSVSPSMLAGGLKVSSITTIYGLLIYAFSLMLWIGSSKLKS